MVKGVTLILLTFKQISDARITYIYVVVKGVTLFFYTLVFVCYGQVIKEHERTVKMRGKMILRFATANNIIIIYTWTSVVATNVLLYTLQHDKRLFNIVFANDVQLQSFFQLNFFIFNKTNATLLCVLFLDKVTQFPM